jgi:hypothetical protein
MHFLAISLLAILAGTLLLLKTRKDALGKFFAFISWFFIVVGFLLFIGFLGGSICKMTNHGKMGHPGCRQEMMMNGCNHGMQNGMCCPGDQCKGNCATKSKCMKQGSMMKCCPMHLEGDSAKMPCPMHMEGDTAKVASPETK